MGMDKPKKPARRITDLRHANFLKALDKFEAESPGRGALARMAQKCGIKSNYLSQIKAGAKPIGPKMAAMIEEGLGYEPGWLDAVHDELELHDTAETIFVRRVLRAFRSASRKGQEDMIESLDEILRRIAAGNFPSTNGN
jgi:transcriptional regulator with XRE-family HTH domain